MLLLICEFWFQVVRRGTRKDSSGGLMAFPHFLIRVKDGHTPGCLRSRGLTGILACCHFNCFYEMHSSSILKKLSKLKFPDSVSLLIRSSVYSHKQLRCENMAIGIVCSMGIVFACNYINLVYVIHRYVQKLK